MPRRSIAARPARAGKGKRSTAYRKPDVPPGDLELQGVDLDLVTPPHVHHLLPHDPELPLQQHRPGVPLLRVPQNPPISSTPGCNQLTQAKNRVPRVRPSLHLAYPKALGGCRLEAMLASEGRGASNGPIGGGAGPRAPPRGGHVEADILFEKVPSV